MLSKFVLENFEKLIEVVLWVLLVGAIALGLASQSIGGFIAAIIGFTVYAVMFFGVVFAITDIKNEVRKIRELLDKET